MTEDDIKQIFFVECEESLEAAEAGLAACREGTHDAETINAIFRAVHSIKGGAGAFGHTALAAYTHGFENLLGDVREGKVPLEPALVDLLLLALDCLRDHVEAARGGGTAPDDADLLARLEAARAGNGGEVAVSPPAPAPASAPTPAADPLDDLDALLSELSAPAAPPAPESWLVHIRPHAGAMTKGSEPLLWLRELTDLGGTCELCDIAPVPTFERLQVEEGYLGWTFRMPAGVAREAVSEIFDFVGDEVALAYDGDPMPPTRIAAAAAPAPAEAPQPIQRPEASAAPAAAPTPPAAAAAAVPAAPAGGAANQSVRIDLKKLDMLIDGVGELVIAQAMLAQRLTNENLAHIEELALIDGLVRDIQEHAMAFRAQPISSVFGRVPRLLRELGGSTGKHVKLEVAGETTELDKTVIERLSEPMTHLIRNAVDHGIEPPEERRAAGKDPEGTLTLSAEQKAGCSMSDMTPFLHTAGHEASPDVVRVTIVQGEAKASSDPRVEMSTILGSCVATCLFDPVSRVGGMNHFLLAEPPAHVRNQSFDSDYGLFLMELLINEMLGMGAIKSRLRARLYGGANLNPDLSPIGTANAAFARQFLARENIPCVFEDLEGTQARRIQFRPASGQVRARLVPSDVAPTEKPLGRPQSALGTVELF